MIPLEEMVLIPKTSKKLTDHQKQQLKDLVEDLTKQVNTFTEQPTEKRTYNNYSQYFRDLIIPVKLSTPISTSISYKTI